jgi:cytochrome c peroxidase
VYLHPFRYDATQGGTTFSDPEKDPLTYEITFGHAYNPYNDPTPPAGVRVEGTSIVGEPAETGLISVVITAKDKSGQTATNEFNIIVDANSDPIVADPNDGLILPVGSNLDYDATKGEKVFSDNEGDPLTYRISLRGRTSNLAVTGTRISGFLDSVGLVEVTVTATDPYGGIATDVFTIAAPAPAPGRPALPAVSYQYDDHELALPYIFRISSDDRIPLWDSQPDDNRTTDAGATLGRVLFYDKRLSSTNTAACASCHQQRYGFAAPEKFSTGPLGVQTKRNVMALANVRYNINNAWFSDMRVNSLHELALLPIANPEELGMSVRLLEAKLAATDFYPVLFRSAFGTPEITRQRIGKALEQFLQSLISYRTKFDRAYNPATNDPPDPAAVLTSEELRGLEIFNGSAGIQCNMCHEANAQTNVWQANNGLDEVPTDPGTQVLALQRDGSRGVFRGASLRNIAVTGPYMHDGRFATLREVIDHYDHDIQQSRDTDAILKDSSGTVRQMNLSNSDKGALEAFLRTLTDDELLTDAKFSDPFE